MSFEELFKKLSPTIKRIAYKLDGRYRCFNHDDLYQEALLHLWGSLNNGKLDGKTDSYILQGCYFHLKNYIRKVNEKPNAVSIESVIGSEEEFTLESALPGEAAGPLDCRQQLHIKLLAQDIQNNGFSRRQKKILASLADGLTTRDIGKRIGLSHVSIVKAVGKIREKARQRLDSGIL